MVAFTAERLEDIGEAPSKLMSIKEVMELHTTLYNNTLLSSEYFAWNKKVFL